MQVDAAYDFLQQRATEDKTELGSSRWSEYYRESLPKWEEQFKKQWQWAYKQKLGLTYSTVIERFARAYIRPRREWFLGTLFPKATLQEKEKYRAHLLAIAPNRQFAEVWALKYYRLEFGEDSPWIFYLSGSVAGDTEGDRVPQRRFGSNQAVARVPLNPSGSACYYCQPSRNCAMGS